MNIIVDLDLEGSVSVGLPEALRCRTGSHKRLTFPRWSQWTAMLSEKIKLVGVVIAAIGAASPVALGANFKRFRSFRT